MLEFIYLICAAFGGTIMLFQFMLAALGFGGDADVSDIPDISDMPDVSDVGDFADSGIDTPVGEVGHTGAGDLMRMLSFRTIVSGSTFFGLGGLLVLFGMNEESVWRNPLSVAVAALCGLFSIFIVYHIYRWMYSLRHDGTVTEATLLGATGEVYVKIPERETARGKVLVNHQGRTMEYEALTQGDELRAGTPIHVVRIISGTTVEVAKN